MTVVLFEDPKVVELHPIAIGRPALAINCGSYRLLDHVRALGERVRAVVRPHLRDALNADCPDLEPSAPIADQVLFVNARVVPSLRVRQRLAGLIDAGKPGVVRTGGDIAAALLPPGSELPQFDLDVGATLAFLDAQPLEALEADLPMFQYPHDVVRHHLLVMNENLEDRLRANHYEQAADGVFLAPGAKLGEYVVTDTSKGPIILETGATIGPHCFLRGPVHVGPHVRVIEHAAIKDFVALGHTTKIGGEVEASIIESYTNKQHHGFLGHSYLGSWINLGAGTCNSDLKNTYGEVNMRYGDKKVPTQMQFIGCIVGDYSKSAINTGLFTGKTIGVCSMVYGFVTTNVPSFVNYARLFGQVTATPVEVMIATQARMFARRSVVQRPCDIQLLQDMFNLTRHERELGSVPPEPLSL